MREIECFYPGRSFPSVSVTGPICALRCKHCEAKYLEGMVPATTPENLLRFAKALEARGAKGFLLSGGSDANGRVPLSDFASTIARIKTETSLKINAHIGLTPRDELAELVRSGIDAFSVDIYGSDETIAEVLGLRATVEDYMCVLKSLKSLKAPLVVPHVCVGVHGGQLRGERRAIAEIADVGVPVLVLISLIPTKGTRYASLLPPSPSDMIGIISLARERMPETKIVFGCMRSKRNRSWEFDAVQAGLDGIVMPSESTVALMKKSGFAIRRRETCCSLYGYL